MNDVLPSGVPDARPGGWGRVAVAAVAALEAVACLAFAAAVWRESAGGPGSSGGVVEGVAAVVVAVVLVAVGAALARGVRRTAGLYAVVQVLVVLIGLSQATSGVAAGRPGFAGSWLVVSAVGAVGLIALTSLMRRAR
ncbi:MAG: hypothetical protein ACFCVG_18690 [Kineosporiaceae bacterium]